VPIVPLYGHQELRERLLPRVVAGTLPQSLLLHGPAGIGKQRLGLWLAQALLCSSDAPPCGKCRECRYSLDLTHPDLTWVFPRPRPKGSDSDPEDIAEDLAEATQKRAGKHGLYAAPPGSEGVYVATVRFLVRQAVRTPALARRKVFVVGDADRMAQQEGAEVAANAFLKLLEEPPADTWVIATTSAVGSLLPTIRSRVVAARVPRLDDSAMRDFMNDPFVVEALAKADLPKAERDRLLLAQGAPGALLSTSVRKFAVDEAKRFIDAATSGNRADLMKVAFVQGHSGARAGYSDTLDALTLALYERMKLGTERNDQRVASSASKAIDLVEEAKRLADANVSPLLISAKLLTDLSRTLR
jgi:DNA polymerase III subunit delta'